MNGRESGVWHVDTKPRSDQEFFPASINTNRHVSHEEGNRSEESPTALRNLMMASPRRHVGHSWKSVVYRRAY